MFKKLNDYLNAKDIVAARTKEAVAKIDAALAQTAPVEKADQLMTVSEELRGNTVGMLSHALIRSATLAFASTALFSLSSHMIYAGMPIPALAPLAAVSLAGAVRGMIAIRRSADNASKTLLVLNAKCSNEIATLYRQSPDNLLKTDFTHKFLARTFNLYSTPAVGPRYEEIAAAVRNNAPKAGP